MTTIHQGLNVGANDNLASGSAEKTHAAPGTTGAAGQGPGSLSSAVSEVAITPTAQLLANVEQQLASVPEVNQGRVDAIRQALANGSYRVNASRIADGLLSAQQLDAQASAGPDKSASLKAFAATAQFGPAKSG